MLYPGSFTDVATNHKLIKRKVLNKLNLVFKGFTLDFEISLKLAKYKFRCDEMLPIIYNFLLKNYQLNENVLHWSIYKLKLS